MTAALLGLVLPTAIVYWALAGSGGLRERPTVGLLHLALAMGLAPGLTSCLWFVWLAWLGMPGRGYLGAEAGLLLLTAAAWRRWLEPRPFPATASAARPALMRVAALVLTLLGLSALVSFTANSLTHPHGSWDAVSIWNLHARFLSAGGDRWIDFFRHGACGWHGDYPLLLPATVARLASVAGALRPSAGVLVGFWFALATVLLCAATVGCVRGTNQALLAAIALLGTSFFVQQSSNQYADVPLAWCMLAAVSALVLHDETGGSAAGWLVLAGAATGLAAWTKNEGMSFVLVIVALRTIAAVRRRDALRGALLFAAGLLPILLVVAYFKLALAPANDLVTGQGLRATSARLLDAGRYVQISAALIAALPRMLKGLLFVLPAYFALMGTTDARRGRSGARLALTVYALMLVSYFAVYVVTPYDLAWHLETSARRLLLQLWPGALVGFFLLVAAPEERIGTEPQMNTDEHRWD
jgi:hypothetical protein